MDVVSAVVFSGNVEVTVSDATATAISLTVPTTEMCIRDRARVHVAGEPRESRTLR